MEHFDSAFIEAKAYLFMIYFKHQKLKNVFRICHKKSLNLIRLFHRILFAIINRIGD